MTTTLFLTMLSAFSVLGGLVTEGFKNLLKDKANLPTNILALIVAMVIGCGGCAVFYQLNDIALTVNNIIYMILMGLASGLTSMVGYDKVRQTIEQLLSANQA